MTHSGSPRFAERVLIVGAGALGSTCAWHLQQGGLRPGFLVRPARAAEMSDRAITLFCLNDNSIRTLDPCPVFGDPVRARQAGFDYILFTLDGAATRAPDGLALLRALHQQDDAVLVLCGVGIGLRDTVIRETAWPEARVVQGTMSMLAYPTRQWHGPLRPGLAQDQHDRCDYAFCRFDGRPAFSVAAKPRRAARRFAGFLAKAAQLEVKLTPSRLYEMFTTMFVSFTIASELNHWRGTASLIGDTALWNLCCESQREIMRLGRHGIAGRFIARITDNKRMARSMLATDQACTGLDFTSFNRLHHGHKVFAQALQILRLCRDEGETEGKAMPATRELLQRIEQRRADEYPAGIKEIV